MQQLLFDSFKLSSFWTPAKKSNSSGFYGRMLRLGLILPLLLSALEAHAQQRALSRQEIMNYCQTGQLPSSVRAVSGLSDLNSYCSSLRTNTRQASAPAAAPNQVTPVAAAAPTPQQAPAEPSPAVPAADLSTEEIARGGNVSGPNPCDENALTAHIP